MLAVPALIIGGIVLSSMAAACMLIVQDSGNGVDDVKDWSEADWLWSGGVVLYLLALALCLGYAVGSLIALAGFDAVMAIAVFVAFLLFPLFMLSGLLEDRLVPPFSVVVVRSLLTHARLWLLVYGLSAVIAAPPILAIVFIWPLSSYAAAFLAPPLLVAACFIYARLLGRLGWRIGAADEAPPRKKKEKKQR